MNPLERVLQNDLDQLVDRLSAAMPEGFVTECADSCPEVLARLEGAEARLSGARLDLLRSYAAWRHALDECADFWAVAELTTDQPRVSGLRAA